MLGLELDTRVSVLFAMSPSASGKWDSPYRKIARCDVWDRERDATQYRGSYPVVAHPPCRAWGKLQRFAKPREGERALACMAVAAVRRFGGVLEHPEGSQLWDFCRLPRPFAKKGGSGPVDFYGGYSIAVNQFHFGHRCEKSTWLYIVGCPRSMLPAIPRREGAPERIISGDTKKSGKSGVSKFERMHTPPAFAEWLVSVAARCTV